MEILIKQVRKSKKMTLRELAELSGVPRSTLSDYENYRASPRMDDLERIALALDVKITDLFYSVYNF